MPIIATNWMYNKDIIQDGVNGLLVPIHNPQAMCEALLKFYRDRNYRTEIAMNNLKEAKKYQPDKVLEVFYRFMDK
ncbi:hypothetical protein SDC9_212727 [bioreactor metagenome]|uniref:Glycosyl transferase family 1 domain-containing protein n=1 Tax=bioreactor metagenome TaxID=1076179 RepID=A0A645JMR5_9ZZZZ